MREGDASAEMMNFRGLGVLILWSAFFLMVSCALGLAFIEGDSLVTVRMFVVSHNFALAFLLTSPLVYGLRKFLAARGAEDAGLPQAVALAWLRMGFFPTALYGFGLYAYMKHYFHASPETFFVLMGAALLLGCYGFVLTRKSRFPAAV